MNKSIEITFAPKKYYQMRYLIFSIFILITACNSENKSATTTASTSGPTGIEDFDSFYKRFHQDTAYQMLHINFPLEGKPQEAAELSEEEKMNFRWQKADWVHHKEITNENFQLEFEILDETLITEYITHKKHKMGMMRRFSKSGGQWNLIYYIAINPLN